MKKTPITPEETARILDTLSDAASAQLNLTDHVHDKLENLTTKTYTSFKLFKKLVDVHSQLAELQHDEIEKLEARVARLEKDKGLSA